MAKISASPTCAAVAVVTAVAIALAPLEYLLPRLSLEPHETSSAAEHFHELPPCIPTDLPSIMSARCLDEARRFPLVLSPLNDTISIEHAAQWIESHRELIHGWMATYGAVLLRGFSVPDPAQFERVASAFTDRLDDVYLGTSPRKRVGDSRYVFTASEFEPWKVVPVHCEMSFLPRPPEHVFFLAAAVPQAMVGGETPLVDMRAVAREMGSSARAAFERKGLRYIRHYPSEASNHPVDKLDFFKTKSYQAMFRHVPFAATNATAVEVESRQLGFEPSWGARHVLKLTHEAEAFRSHPTSGERIWHNHFAVLHSAAWADEFAFAAAHLRSKRYALIAQLFYALDTAMHLLQGAEALGQHVTHRGGSNWR